MNYFNVKSFINNLKHTDNICILYHRDNDGICSAVLMLKILYKNNLSASFFDFSLSEDEEVFNTLVKKFNKFIILDIPFDQAKEVLVTDNIKILIIDHHPPIKNLSSENIVHYNIHFEKNVYQPVSYLVYKIFEDELKDYDWVATIGTVSDYGIDDCLDLISKFIKNPTKENVSKSKLMKIADMLYGNSIFSSCNDVIELLFNSKSLEELEKNKILKETYKNYRKEIKRLKKKYLEKSENLFDGRLIFGLLNSKYKRLSSSVSTELCSEDNSKIFIVYEERKGKFSVSARTGISNIDLGKIFKEISNEINISAGGHPNAAGALLPKNKINIFKEKLIEKIKPFLQ
ncbi:MAG: DHHA1 domain-containing protein [Candidatus Aenigmatarchaeota archaeon]